MELVPTFYANPALLCRPPHEVFLIVRMLLSDITLWAQGARARTEDGTSCHPHDPQAACWSLNGALAIASNPRGVTPPMLLEFLDGIVREWGLVSRLYEEGGVELWETCDDFNDHRPHRFVLALLDEAAARTATL